MLASGFRSTSDAAVPSDDTPTTPRADAMRVIYLLLAFFILTGIGANCRTAAVQATVDCASSTGMSPCEGQAATDASD